MLSLMGANSSRQNCNETARSTPASSYFNRSSSRPSSSVLVQDLTSTHEGPIHCLCPIGQELMLSAGVDKDVLLYSWSKHITRARFKGASKDVTKVCYNSKLCMVYAASRDRSIYAWKWPEEESESSHSVINSEALNSNTSQLFSEPMTTLQGHTLGVTGLATSTVYPQLLCSGSRDNSVCLWDCEMGRSVSSMYALRNIVTGVEWVEGEKAVVQSSEDKTLRVWDLTSCSTVQQFKERNHMQTCCAVSSNGQQLLAGSSGSGQGSQLTLWDRRNEKRPLREFKGHTENVQDCMFFTHQEHNMVCSVGSDSTLKLWDLKTASELHSEYCSGAGPLTSIVSPAPGLVSCSSFKGGVLIWTVLADLSNSNSLNLSMRSKY